METKTADELKSDDVLALLGDGFKKDLGKVNGGYPVLSWQTSEGPEPSVQLGDIDGDGDVTPLDAAMVYAISMQEYEANELQQQAADVDGDGEITPLDAAMVYAYAMQELTKFPAEG